MDKFMLTVDEISTFVGKAAAWLVVLLMLMVFTDVVRRYALNSPSAWIGRSSSARTHRPPAITCGS